MAPGVDLMGQAPGGTDLAIIWDAATGRGDWTMDGGGLLLGNPLESAVLVSLFTDRVKSPDFTPQDGTTDPRGWWADSFEATPIGSRLWELDRVKKANAQSVRLRAEDFCREALQWLLDDGVAASVKVSAAWASPSVLGIRILITKPDGTRQPFAYDWAWAGVA